MDTAWSITQRHCFVKLEIRFSRKRTKCIMLAVMHENNDPSDLLWSPSDGLMTYFHIAHGDSLSTEAESE
jgi:hypothetical protein